MIADYKEAKYLVVVEVTKAWVNCPRYNNKTNTLYQSRYVPVAATPTPLAAWKRTALVQDALSPEDQQRANEEGLLELSEYEALVARGEA